MSVISERDTTELQLVQDPLEKCGINAKAFSAEQEWQLHKENIVDIKIEGNIALSFCQKFAHSWNVVYHLETSAVTKRPVQRDTGY